MKINMAKPFFLTLLLCAVSMSISAQEKRQANGHEYVDLGLSVKWATCNIGATRPSEFGEYYVWGETSSETLKSDVDVEEQLNKSIHPDSGYDAARERYFPLCGRHGRSEGGQRAAMNCIAVHYCLCLLKKCAVKN